MNAGMASPVMLGLSLQTKQERGEPTLALPLIVDIPNKEENHDEDIDKEKMAKKMQIKACKIKKEPLDMDIEWLATIPWQQSLSPKRMMEDSLEAGPSNLEARPSS